MKLFAVVLLFALLFVSAQALSDEEDVYDEDEEEDELSRMEVGIQAAGGFDIDFPPEMDERKKGKKGKRGKRGNKGKKCKKNGKNCKDTEEPSASPTKTPAVIPEEPRLDYPDVDCTELSARTCGEYSGKCEWYRMTPCEPGRGCNTFEYGCQERSTFCEFIKGNRLDQQLQCNAKAFPCKWNRSEKTCFAATRAPSPEYNGKWPFVGPSGDDTVCSDTCGSKNDGICEDGGPSSESATCAYGTDCTDCGARIVQ
jgi:hypothetical protein